jgi:hypothetical protein
MCNVNPFDVFPLSKIVRCLTTQATNIISYLQQVTIATVQLLRHGAHGLVGHEEEKAREEEAFRTEGIDAILAGRTIKRTIGSRKGNTFSTASFTLEQDPKVRNAMQCSLDPTCR